MATTFTLNDAGTIAYGGETNDTSTETLDSLVGTVNVAPSGLFSQTGSKCMAFDMSANGNRATLRGDDAINRLGTTGITVVSFAAGLSTAPSSEACLMAGLTTTSPPAAGTAFDRRYIRFGTDRKLYLYDKAGSVIVGGTSTSTIPTAGAMKEVVISYDGLTNPANTWITMWVDGVEELAFACGQPLINIFNSLDQPYWGESCATGTNKGCILYLDDFTVRYSATAAEAPHLIQYPRIRVAVPVTADSQATFSQWAISGSAPPATHYGCIQTDDAAVSFLRDAVNGEADSWKSSTANPMPVGATVIKAQLRQVTRLTGAGKNVANMNYGTTGAPKNQTVAIIGSASTSFTARINAQLLQDGSSTYPVYADANANASEWGVTNPSSGTPGTDITFGPGPEWVYYTSLLPLGTAPTAATAPDTSNPGTATDAAVV